MSLVTSLRIDPEARVVCRAPDFDDHSCLTGSTPDDTVTTSPMLDAVLAEAGITPEDFAGALEAAATMGSDAGSELIAHGIVTEENLGRAIARTMRLPFGEPGPMDLTVGRRSDSDARHLRTCTIGLEARFFLAPRLETIDQAARWLKARDHDKIVVTTASALRAHAAAQSTPRRLHDARFHMAAERPEWSARSVLTARQGYALGIGTAGLFVCAAIFGPVLWTAAHIILSLFFAACSLFRLFVLLDFDAEQRRQKRERDKRENDLRLPVGRLPVYTVLVALYREEEMIEPLIDALSRLNWPRSRLDVKLVCEADDAATITAVERHIAGKVEFEIVRVPASKPRTKPKALNHALPLARGEYVVLYDAEDRPDPDQLLEAWLAFSTAGPDLACVQAPLVIRNGGQNWLTGMFALEYAVLFRALLPFLARRRLPIALGGTSNHFRRKILVEIGGWDSHNVAEDADLGIRLARHRYRTDVICAPTSEIAPGCWRDWRNQRTRWVKGWIQTYLVHMRQPIQSLRDLGAMRMAAFQLLFIGMVAGAVMHTAFVAYVAIVAARLLLQGSADFAPNWLMGLDVFNIVVSGLIFTLLALRVLVSNEQALVGRLWGLWLYWLLVSLASARSIVQLVTDPHGWEKTPHHESALSPTSERLAGSTGQASRSET